ncbi:MAG: YraN family protein [Kiritimatiellales bacterium]|nr:YraN family protein [Kiritimatiellales bacterium]
MENTLSPAHMIVGQEGEIIADTYMRSLGYLFYDRNVRIGHDEIDLIMFDRGARLFIFVEVKARSSFSDDYRPELNFTSSKKGKMLRAVRAWIDQHQFDGGYRCDLVCVANSKVVEHLCDIETK